MARGNYVGQYYTFSVSYTSCKFVTSYGTYYPTDTHCICLLSALQHDSTLLSFAFCWEDLSRARGELSFLRSFGLLLPFIGRLIGS